MNLQGIGIVFSGGRGLAALDRSLTGAWTPPVPLAIPERDSAVPAYAIPADALADKTALKAMRRADRFGKIATLAAWDAWHDAGLADLDETARARTGIVLGSALGPHVTTFRFLDDILAYGDTEVSPTAFSHSVHNAAVSYVATRLGIRGPALTVTDFHFSLPYALLQARIWLSNGRCDRVLVGTTDELGTVMGYIARHKMRIPTDGHIRPEAFSSQPAAVPGEAGVFFLVDHGTTPGTYGRIDKVAVPDAEPDTSPTDSLLYDANGLLSDETPYRALCAEARERSTDCVSHADRFGSVPSGLSLHLAAAALALKHTAPDSAAPLRRIACVKLNGRGQRATISANRQP